jgi:hypothetical protein
MAATPRAHDAAPTATSGRERQSRSWSIAAGASAYGQAAVQAKGAVSWRRRPGPSDEGSARRCLPDVRPRADRLPATATRAAAHAPGATVDAASATPTTSEGGPSCRPPRLLDRRATPSRARRRGFVTTSEDHQRIGRSTDARRAVHRALVATSSEPEGLVARCSSDATPVDNVSDSTGLSGRLIGISRATMPNRGHVRP